MTAHVAKFVPLVLAATLLFAPACDGDGAPQATVTAAASRTAVTVETPSPVPATATPIPTGAPAPSATPGTPAEATIISRGDPSRREVALTFDAGADAGFTSDILAELAAEEIRASFAVTGLWAEANADLLLSIAAGGHVLMNHTYDHRSFTGYSTNTAPLSPELRALELSRVETTAYRLTSRSTRPYFRPPFGDVDASVQRDAAAAGYGVIVMWPIDTLGWDGALAGAIVDRTLRLAEPGAIVIMHVGSESQDAAALPEVIDRLRAEGYGFVTIPEMVAHLSE